MSRRSCRCHPESSPFVVSQPFQPYTLIQSTSALVGADAESRAPAQAALFDAQMVRRTFNGSFSREMLAVQARTSVPPYVRPCRGWHEKG